MIKFSIPPPSALFRAAARLFIPAVMILTFASPRATAGSIVRNGTATASGTGFGNVLTLLVLQNNGSEYGSVLRNASNTADVLTQDATNQSSTRTVQELLDEGVSASSDNLSILFQVNQTGSNLTLNLFSFTLRFYTSTSNNTSFFDVTWDAGSSTDNPGGTDPQALGGVGVGTSGHLFNITLTSAERSAFFANTGNRVGMFINSGDAITNSNDGPDNFFLIKDNRSGGGSGTVVPAPSAIVLAASGLLCLGLGGLRTLRRRPSLAA